MKTRSLNKLYYWLEIKRGIYFQTFSHYILPAFHYIKHVIYKIGIQFHKSVLVVEQKNDPTKIVNSYIVYDLDNLPRNLHNNFT